MNDDAQADGITVDEGKASVVRDIAWCAAEIDAAAALSTRFEMAQAVRACADSKPYGDLPPDISDELKAACWAFDYHVEIDAHPPRYVRIEPRFNYGDRTDPPQVKDVPEVIRAAWAELLQRVEHPAATSRLNHILFEYGGRERQQHGADAIDAYVKSADHWGREFGSLQDLMIGERLANAVGDIGRAQLCIDALLDIAENELATDNPRTGLLLRALEHAILAPQCPASPAHADVLLERSATELADVRARDDALSVMLRRCQDTECRRGVWRRRVEAFIQAAADTDDAMLRLVFRREALQFAEQSGMQDLRELAAGQLQLARDDDLGLISYEFTCALYDEHAEQTRQSFIAGPDWQRALITFARAGPLSGDVKANSAAIEAERSLAPLRFLMPQFVLGPDQLPILSAVTEQEKFQYELVVKEKQIAQSYVRPLVTALHDITAKFGLPTGEELARFLATWPSGSPLMVNRIVQALHRYWAGDSEGATYTLVPQIEGHIRQLILATNRGIFKLQTTHAPGLYPGLGAMLNILPEEFDIDESRMRFLKVVLVEPAGFNLRNHLAHGTVVFDDPGTAAVAIHVALFLLTLSPKPPVADRATDS
jgi:hypothetical protein